MSLTCAASAFGQWRVQREDAFSHTEEDPTEGAGHTLSQRAACLSEPGGHTGPPFTVPAELMCVLQPAALPFQGTKALVCKVICGPWPCCHGCEHGQLRRGDSLPEGLGWDTQMVHRWSVGAALAVPPSADGHL